MSYSPSLCEMWLQISAEDVYKSLSVMGILPPKHALPLLRQFCVAPCITAHAEEVVSEYAVGFSMLSLYSKLELVLDKLAMPSISDEELDLHTRTSLKCLTIFPVLSLLALVDMGRLQKHTPVHVILVPRISSRLKEGEACINQLLDYATVVTWAM